MIVAPRRPAEQGGTCARDGSAGGRGAASTAAILILVIVVGIPSAALAQSAARWYDAYADGVQAVERGDWATGERLLQQAKAGGPAPGRRVFTYGDTYIRFLPDYYLGVIYLNTGRAAEAEQAFTAVRAQGLVTSGDPEYATFEQQNREATFTNAFEAAVQLAAAGQFAEASSRLDAARATGVDPKKVADLSAQINQSRATAQVTPRPPQLAQGDGAPYTPQGQGVTLPAMPRPPAMSPTLPSGIGRSGPSPYNPEGPVLGDPLPAASRAARQGILAYFSGNYRDAVRLLQAAGPGPVDVRDRFFLACAKTALVLSGGADIALLREARADYGRLDPQGRLQINRDYISPRVLAELERP